MPCVGKAEGGHDDQPLVADLAELGAQLRDAPLQLRAEALKMGLLAVGAVTVFGALAAATFWLPYGTLTRQDDDIARKEQELAALEQANAGLANEVDRLKTPEGIEEAAREEIGYVPSPSAFTIETR